MIHRLADNRNALFWALNIGGWTGYAVLNYLMGIAGHDKPPDYIVPSLMYALGGLVVTYGLRHIYKAAWDMRPAWSFLISGAGATAAAALFSGYRSFVYVHVYEGFRMGTLPVSDYFHTLELTLSLYVIGTWSGLYFGIKYYRMVQQQREQVLKATSSAHEAQLKTLRFQLNPHFLFNTLNAISTLMLEGDNVSANRMLTRLSAFLRHSLDRDPRQKIRLKEELHALDLYLGLEQIRFDDRLDVELEIEDEAYEALVPGMILQPLIENAIRHAISESETGGRITIAAKSVDDMLYLSIADTRPGIPDPANAISPGNKDVGLANTRERLQVLYGEAHTFSATSVKPHGLKLEISIPLEHGEQ